VQLTLDERNQSAESALVALPPFQKQSGRLPGVVRDVVILRLSAECTGWQPFPASLSREGL
jgi:hypothetical protein